ncbi:MAG: CotH kinase family protein [Lachnospiraceae bacterium]|nr:CotH kinase family protein [Lachnospiraceae bacterium]
MKNIFSNKKIIEKPVTNLVPQEINTRTIPIVLTVLLVLLVTAFFWGKRPFLTSDMESGFYEEGFLLNLCSNDDAEIYYTLDGSEPNKESQRYEGPIFITDRSNDLNILSTIEDAVIIKSYHIPTNSEFIPKGTVIRAVAYNKNLKSEELDLVFFVGLNKQYRPKNMMTISITADSDDLFEAERGIYVAGSIWEKEKDSFEGGLNDAPGNFTQEGEQWERDAIVSTILPSGEAYTENIILSIHGECSTRFNQKSLNLKKLSKDGFLHSIFDSKSLILQNGGRDLYSSQMKDVLCQRLIEGRNVRIQRAVPVQVFINGEYWGFYWCQERIDNHFIAAEYGVKENQITVVKAPRVVEGNDRKYDAYKDILEWVEDSDLSDDSTYQKLCEWIDVDSYIDYMCFEIYVQNLDCISNNVAMWKTDYKDASNEYADGKWRWIIYDTESSCFDPTMDSFIENNAAKAPLDDLLFIKLLQNGQFRKLFRERFHEIVDYNFEYERIERFIDEIVDEVKDVVIASHVRFIGPKYDDAQYYQDVEDIKRFFRERKSYILKYLDVHVEE